MAVFSQQLAQNLSCAAWNSDGTLLAMSPNDASVRIYEMDAASGALRLLQQLGGDGDNGTSGTSASGRGEGGDSSGSYDDDGGDAPHHQLVSACDWSCRGQLATCSHDRTVCVWTRDDDDSGSGGGGAGAGSSPPGGAAPSSRRRWRAETVMARLPRAALCCAWSPDGAKLAVGSAARSVVVCHHDAANGWYAAKPLKARHESSVTGVAWHPGGLLLATCSTDGAVRVCNAALPGIDAKSIPGCAFGDVLLETELERGWVHGLAWSPSGEQLAAVAHEGSAVVVFSGIRGDDRRSVRDAEQQELCFPGLPLKCAAFLSEEVLVVAGFDARPWLLVRNPESEWVVGVPLSGASGGGDDDGGEDRAASGAAASGRSSAAGARPGSAQSGRGAGGRSPYDGPHSNLVLRLQAFADAAGVPTGWFASSGLDGVAALWDIRRRFAAGGGGSSDAGAAAGAAAGADDAADSSMAAAAPAADAAIDA